MKDPNLVRRGPCLLILFLALSPCLATAAISLPRSPDVQKVYDAFALLRRSATQPPAAKPRTIALTDAELNAYIAYRIKTEKSSVLRDLRLHVFPENRVEGLMFLDLSRIGAPSFLKPTLNFYFAGRLATQNAKIKFEVTSLYLGYQSVPVFLLDAAFFIASKTQKHGPAGLADWYELPLGLKNITSEAGRVLLHF
jgi:hypothetical protein